MSKRKFSFKSIIEIVGGITVLLGALLIYNVFYWASEGNPTIPRLEGRWWAGYYQTLVLGRQWCVVRFTRAPSGGLQMALLSPSGAPDFFNVQTDSSDDSFVHLTFIYSATPPMRIEAKQAYAGKRYFFGRLLNGRFGDFWEMNEDIRILGNIVSVKPPQEFAIEPIDDDKLESFWRNYVRPEQSTSSPLDLLSGSK